jgi:WD40 repeat protein
MDESLLAVGYENYGFGILKLDENRMLINNSGELNAGLVDAVAFLKNQRNLVTSGGDNRITIYETKNWEPVGTINDHQAVVNEIAVSRSGKYIASGDMNGQVIVRRTNLKE